MSRTLLRRLRLWLPALLAAALLTATAGAAGATAATRPVPNSLGGAVWNSVPTRVKVVALTFDAGGNADGVTSILTTLRQQKAHATFFLTGNFTRDFPAAARSIADAGLRVGDHSISHPYFTRLADAQMREQVLGAQSQIVSATGADPWPWFRFPFGDYNAHTISVVNSVGFVPIGWTVDTLGWKGTSGGQSTGTVVSRVLASLKPGEIVLMHCGSNPDDDSTLDASALPTVIKELRARGYSFVTIDALRGLGYDVLGASGGVYNFGAPWYGSDRGKLPSGVSPVAVAVDPATGGYWILRSNGGVSNYNAPWYGSLAGKVPAGSTVTGIAASKGGYLVLTSDGGVHNFGARWYGSDRGKLPSEVTAKGLAADPATGGYWILRSNGGVGNHNAPWYGSLKGRMPAGATAEAIAHGSGTGYLVLTSNGGVHNFGATWYGSDRGKLPPGVTARGLAADPATGGYWILRSNGGVGNHNAPWYGSLAGTLPAGEPVTAIAGQ